MSSTKNNVSRSAQITSGKTKYGAFKEYVRVGLTQALLPIMPPDAPLSNGMDAERREHLSAQRGKIPGREKNDSTWVGFGDWTKLVATEKDVAEWAPWTGVGVGIQGRQIGAVDIDVEDAALAAEIEQIVLVAIGAAPVRTRDGSPRRLIPFVWAGGKPGDKARVAFEDLFGDKHAVEVLGNGQQWVAEGAHKSGVRYRWRQGATIPAWGVGKLPVVAAGDVGSLLQKVVDLVKLRGFSAVRAGRGGLSGTAERRPLSWSGFKAPDDALLLEALAKIPNDLSYDDWFRVLVALKAGANDEMDVAEAAVDWSLEWPDNTIDSVLAKWDSIHDAGVGAEFVFARAREYGWYGDAVYDFGGGIGGVRGKGVGGKGGQLVEDLDDLDQLEGARDEKPSDKELTKAAERAALRAEAQRMVSRFRYVLASGEFFDMKQRLLLGAGQFNALNASEHMPVGSSTKRPSSVYLDFVAKETFLTGVEFKPGSKALWRDPADKRLYANIWQPPRFEPDPCDVFDAEPFVEFLEYLIPDYGARSAFVWWLAHMVQKPHERVNWHPLLVGSQGVGKTTVVDVLQRWLSPESISEVGASQLVKDFNAWAGWKQLIVVEEMQGVGAEGYNKLKTLMTNAYVSIERKGKDVIRSSNTARFLMTSNEDDAIKLSAEDRRFLVVRCADRPKPQSFYKTFWDWLEHGGGIEASVGYLKGLDLGATYRGVTFDRMQHAPVTAAKEQMRLDTRSSLEAWLEERLANRQAPFDRPYVRAEDVESAADTAPGIRFSNRVAVGKILRKLGLLKVRMRLGGEHSQLTWVYVAWGQNIFEACANGVGLRLRDLVLATDKSADFAFGFEDDEDENAESSGRYIFSVGKTSAVEKNFGPYEKMFFDRTQKFLRENFVDKISSEEKIVDISTRKPKKEP